MKKVMPTLILICWSIGSVYSQGSFRVLISNGMNQLHLNDDQLDTKATSNVYVSQFGVSYLQSFLNSGISVELSAVTDVFSEKLKHSSNRDDQRGNILFGTEKYLFRGSYRSSSLELSISKEIYDKFRFGSGVGFSYGSSLLENEKRSTLYFVNFRPPGSLIDDIIQLDEPAVFEEKNKFKNNITAVSPVIYGEYSFNSFLLNIKYTTLVKKNLNFRKSNSLSLSVIFKII